MAEMTTMNVSMPKSLRKYVESEVKRGGYSSASELFREMVRQRKEEKKRSLARLEELLVEGLESGPATEWTAGDFQRIREQGRKLIEEKNAKN